VNLPAQVAAFLEQVNGVANSEALFVIEIGGNDIRDALQAAATGDNPAPIIGAALNSIATNIAALHVAGARRFLVWRVPNIALTPAIRTLGPGAGFAATQLTIAFNTGLDGVLGQLAALPGIEIRRLDAYQKLNAINANPAAFGLTNVATACITPNAAPYVCDDPDQFLFWDGIHPTRAGHSILAQEAAAVLAP
jgi:phospholipase/lecithinase/hemolysin